MTQNEKDLLLKDLCARLPYGVKGRVTRCDSNNRECEFVATIDGKLYDRFAEFQDSWYDNITIKPYLFPLSSITEEQAIELFNIFGISLVDSVGANYIKVNEVTGITFFFQNGFDVETHLDRLINWLNKNHLDWRGLIPKGLAIDATNLNIY